MSVVSTLAVSENQLEIAAITTTETPEQAMAICADNITIAYRSYEKRPTTLKESFIRMLKEGRIKHYSTFDALKSVSFSVKKGSVVGFIGSNGAGKSTLLRVIAGVLPPTKGRIEVIGRVDSLIQLGAGFDPELNAVENIYLNGSLRGFSRKHIKQRVQHILEFAELQEFATTPIKYYSSGMFARLGFSVAIDHHPEILIVDEVLAVGDERFQQKCADFFTNYRKNGNKIVMVSHDLGMMENFADEIGLLSKGRLIYFGSPAEAIARYRSPEYQTAL